MRPLSAQIMLLLIPRIWRTALNCLLALLPTAAVSAAEYTITPITWNTDRHYPSINNLGTVAFLEYRDATSLGIHLHYASGLESVVTGSVFWPSPAARIVNLNNLDQVVFHGRPETTSTTAIYQGTTAGFTKLADSNMIYTSTGSNQIGGFRPAVFLTDTGVATFDFSGGGTIIHTRGHDLYTSNGTQITNVLSQTQTRNSSTQAAFQGLASSANGTIAYEYYLDGFSRSEVRVQQGTTIRTVMTIPPDVGDTGGINSLDVNNQGNVLISGLLKAGGTTTTDAGLYLDNGTGVTKLIDTGSTQIYQSIHTATLNNFDQIAFTAIRHLESGITGDGIYVGPNGLADQIVAVGDLIDGRAVTALQLGTTGLNDQGQIVFWAGFANGAGGVFLASPTIVPEPTTWFAAILMVAATYAAQRRHRARQVTERDTENSPDIK